MENPLSSMVGETRARLLGLLRRGQQSVADLGTALGITDNAVRMHIAALERDGLVTAAGSRRDTGGKPSRLYDLTARAEELFPKAYSLVLSALAREIKTQDGRDRLVTLLRAVGQKAAAGAPADGVDAAAAALRGLGGEVEVQRTDGGWQIRGHGCPLAAVVTEHAEVCQLTQSLVAEITGRPVREHCDRTGRPRCAFHISDQV